jgi:hypothetical protein
VEERVLVLDTEDAAHVSCVMCHLFLQGTMPTPWTASHHFLTLERTQSMATNLIVFEHVVDVYCFRIPSLQRYIVRGLCQCSWITECSLHMVMEIKF